MGRILRVRRRAAPAAAAALLLALGACAPPPPGRLETLRERYESARTKRAACLDALTAQAVVRVDGRATGRLPALIASLAVAAPARARLRARLLTSVLVDACAGGDSLVVWVPRERVALTLGGAGDTALAVAPVGLLVCALGATWEPPAEAWRAAQPPGAGATLCWREGEDSLALDIGADALPRSARWWRGEVSVRAHYEAWQRTGGTDFPGRLEVGDDSGWARVDLELEDARAESRPRDDWFAQRLPEGTRRVDANDLARRLPRSAARP